MAITLLISQVIKYSCILSLHNSLFLWHQFCPLCSALHVFIMDSKFTTATSQFFSRHFQTLSLSSHLPVMALSSGDSPYFSVSMWIGRSWGLALVLWSLSPMWPSLPLLLFGNLCLDSEVSWHLISVSAPSFSGITFSVSILRKEVLEVNFPNPCSSDKPLFSFHI